MQQARQEDVAERLLGLTATVEAPRLVPELRAFARELLDSGYPRETLVEDFESVRAEMRRRDDEEREDAVMDVMDFLVGWCSPGAKL